MKTTTFYIVQMFLTAYFISAQTPEEAVRFLENENGIGVKAHAMGNSFAGVADDYTAIYWNPAGLTQLNSSEISGELYHHIFKNEANFAGNRILENQNFTKFKSLGLAYKFPTIRGSFVIAFGYNRFKDYDDFLYFSGFNTQSNRLEFELENQQGEYSYYTFDKNVLQTEEITKDGGLAAYSFAAGIAMSPNFSMGVAVNSYTGSSQYQLDLFQHDTDNLYSNFPADFKSYELHQNIHSEFSGWGIKIGSLFQFTKDLRLGLAIDLPTVLHIKETYTERDALTFDDDYVSEEDLGSGEWEYLVRYPFKIISGISLDTKLLMLTGSFEYRDWTQVKFDIPDGFSLNADFDDLLNENESFATLFRPVISYSAGGELRIPGTGLKLRGGYRLVPSLFYEADKTLDRRYLSCGFGLDVDQYTCFNISYTRGFWKRYSIDSYTPGGTHETIETDRVLAGITYRF